MIQYTRLLFRIKKTNNEVHDMKKVSLKDKKKLS